MMMIVYARFRYLVRKGSTFAPVNLNVAAMYYFMISPRLQNVHFGSEIAGPAPVINDEEEPRL